MPTDWTLVLLAAAFPPVSAWYWSTRAWAQPWYGQFWFTAAATAATQASAELLGLPSAWLAVLISGAWIAAWMWRRAKDKRKRAAELIGAKARALRGRLVANMPGPVPEGAS